MKLESETKKSRAPHTDGAVSAQGDGATPEGWQVSYPATEVKEDAGVRATRFFTFDFRDHKGFEKRINLGVNASSIVLASICEVGVFGGQVLPFQGGASLSVDNIVPHNDGTVTVRGSIGWESDVNARLSFLVGP